jgi:hypothetical protein
MLQPFTCRRNLWHLLVIDVVGGHNRVERSPVAVAERLRLVAVDQRRVLIDCHPVPPVVIAHHTHGDVDGPTLVDQHAEDTHSKVEQAVYLYSLWFAGDGLKSGVVLQQV